MTVLCTNLVPGRGLVQRGRRPQQLSDYLETRLGGMPPDPVLGTAEARTRSLFAPRIAHARSTLLDALNSARYYAMLAELDRLLADPPLTAAAAKPAARSCRQRSPGPTGGPGGGCCAPARRRAARAATPPCTRRGRRPSAPGTRRRPRSRHWARRRTVSRGGARGGRSRGGGAAGVEPRQAAQVGQLNVVMPGADRARHHE